MRKLDINSIVNVITWGIIFVLVIYIIFHGFELFTVSDVKESVKTSTQQMVGKIIRPMIKNYNPTVSYVLKKKDDSDEKVWESAVFEEVCDQIPLYDYVENSYEESNYNESDPSYVKKYFDNPENVDENTTASTETTASSTEETTVSEQPSTAPADTNTISPIVTPPITGVEYSLDKLNDFDFLVNSFYTVSASTTLKRTDLVASDLLNVDMKMTHDNSTPQILIYHTHSQEDFVDSVPGDASTTIVGVGEYLAEILRTQYGYNVIHDTGTYDLVNGVLDRNKAYDYAGDALAQILADNPSIEVVLDIHRDGVNSNLHLVTDINGKQTAKIMFFNGLSRLTGIGDIDYLYNPFQKENLALSLQMKLKAVAYYPDFTRKNYVNAYQYNLHMRAKSMLIEVGAQTNTLQEEKNAMEPLADLLHMILQ